MSDLLSHEFFTLIGVKVLGKTLSSHDGLFETGEHQCSIVVFTYPPGKYLSSGSVHDGDEIPEPTLVLEVAGVTHPYVVGDHFGLGDLCNLITVVMIAGGNGAVVVFVTAPRCSQLKELHHPLGPLVIHFQVERHPLLTVGSVNGMSLTYLTGQLRILSWLLGSVVDHLTTDTQ